MPYNTSKDRASENAEASLRMEGFRITPKIRCNAQRLANGEISVEECVKEMLAKPGDKKDG